MKRKINKYINKWLLCGYEKGIPDEAPPKFEALNKAPSYRNICKAILKNDLQLKTLGFSKEKCEYYNILKKIEIEERNI